jgi:hypothetical protein
MITQLFTFRARTFRGVDADVPLTRDLLSSPSRCLHGALKGTIGVVKSMISELTDETNVARGFSLLPTTWAFGGVIGLATLARSCSSVLPNVLMPYLVR